LVVQRRKQPELPLRRQRRGVFSSGKCSSVAGRTINRETVRQLLQKLLTLAAVADRDRNYGWSSRRSATTASCRRSEERVDECSSKPLKSLTCKILALDHATRVAPALA